MYRVKTPLIIPLTRKATTSSAFTIKAPLIKTKGVIVVDGVSCMNDVRNNSWCSVGIRRGGVNYYYETLDMIEKEIYYTTTHSITMREYDQLVFKIQEHGSGDTFQILITAHLEEWIKENNG